MFTGKLIENLQCFSKIFSLKYNEHIRSVKLYFKERKKKSTKVTITLAHNLAICFQLFN